MPSFSRTQSFSRESGSPGPQPPCSKKNDSRRDAETRRCVVRGAVARASGQSRPGSLELHGLADARQRQNALSFSASPRLCVNQFFFFTPSKYSMFVLFAVLHPLIHAMIPVALLIGRSDRKSTRLNSSH